MGQKGAGIPEGPAEAAALVVGVVEAEVHQRGGHHIYDDGCTVVWRWRWRELTVGIRHLCMVG